MRRRAEAMTRTFQEEAKQPNFPGLLVDFDHFSHDPAQPTTAAGWLTALEHRDDGLYAQVRWSDLGHPGAAGRAVPARFAGVEPGPIAIRGPRRREPRRRRSRMCGR